MTIADQITRLNNAKAAIKTSLENKGVTVSDSALLDEYAALIDSIVVGGNEGGNESYYEELFNVRTNNGRNCAYLFYDCTSVELDTSKLNTSNAVYMNYMFNSCSFLESLDVSNFNTSNVTTMSHMFDGCTKLTTLDVSNWNTTKVNNMSYMFNDCINLTSLDVSNWNINESSNISNLFNNCTNLTSIEGINNWNVSKATNIEKVFYYCSHLTSLDVSNWDVGHITLSSYISQAFNNCKRLVDFQAPKNINTDMKFSGSTALSHDSLMSIINNLMTTTTTKTLTLGSDNLAKLTDDEKAIATGKGWTIK